MIRTGVHIQALNSSPNIPDTAARFKLQVLTTLGPTWLTYDICKSIYGGKDDKDGDKVVTEMVMTVKSIVAQSRSYHFYTSTQSDAVSDIN